MPKNIAYIRDIRILFLVYIVNILICVYFIYNRVQGLRESQNWISHSITVQKYLEQSFAYLKEAEGAQRGFLLTDDSSFLLPFHAAYDDATQSIEKVEDLTKDNLEQQKNVLELKTLATRRFYLLNETLGYKDFFSENFAAKKEHLLKGKAEMDSLKQCIENMLAIEGSVLQEHEKHRTNYEQMTLKYALGLILFSVAIITFCYFWLMRELKKKLNSASENANAKAINLSKGA